MPGVPLLVSEVWYSSFCLGPMLRTFWLLRIVGLLSDDSTKGNPPEHRRCEAYDSPNEYESSYLTDILFRGWCNKWFINQVSGVLILPHSESGNILWDEWEYVFCYPIVFLLGKTLLSVLTELKSNNHYISKMPLKQPKEHKVLSQSQASMAFIHHFTLTLASKLHLRRPTTRQGRNDDGAKFVNAPICTT